MVTASAPRKLSGTCLRASFPVFPAAASGATSPPWGSDLEGSSSPCLHLRIQSASSTVNVCLRVAPKHSGSLSRVCPEGPAGTSASLPPLSHPSLSALSDSSLQLTPNAAGPYGGRSQLPALCGAPRAERHPRPQGGPVHAATQMFQATLGGHMGVNVQAGHDPGGLLTSTLLPLKAPVLPSVLQRIQCFNEKNPTQLSLPFKVLVM